MTSYYHQYYRKTAVANHSVILWKLPAAHSDIKKAAVLIDLLDLMKYGLCKTDAQCLSAATIISYPLSRPISQRLFVGKLLLTPFSRGRNWGTERLSHLHKVTQLAMGRASSKPQKSGMRVCALATMLAAAHGVGLDTSLSSIRYLGSPQKRVQDQVTSRVSPGFKT